MCSAPPDRPADADRARVAARGAQRRRWARADDLAREYLVGRARTPGSRARRRRGRRGARPPLERRSCRPARPLPWSTTSSAAEPRDPASARSPASATPGRVRRLGHMDRPGLVRTPIVKGEVRRSTRNEDSGSAPRLRLIIIGLWSSASARAPIRPDARPLQWGRGPQEDIEPDTGESFPSRCAARCARAELGRSNFSRSPGPASATTRRRRPTSSALDPAAWPTDATGTARRSSRTRVGEQPRVDGGAGLDQAGRLGIGDHLGDEVLAHLATLSSTPFRRASLSGSRSL